MKTKPAVRIFLFSAVVLSLSACQKFPVDWTGLQLAVEESFYLPQRAEGKVVARLNGVPITAEEIAAQLKKYPAEYRAKLTANPDQKSFLDMLIQTKILAQLARQSGLDESRSVRLDARLHRDSLLVQAYRNEALKPLQKLTQEEITQRYYFLRGRPMRIAISRLDMKTVKDAQAAMDMLQTGAPFPQVAAKMRARKALLSNPIQTGLLPQSKRDPNLEKNLALMQDGKTALVHTPEGIAVIRREKSVVEPVTPQDLASMRATVEWTELQNHILRAKAKMKIETDEKALAEILNRLSQK